MYEIDKAQFGRFVAELRREKNYTQKQLAELLNISDKAISKWERGLSLPDVSMLLPLADILDVSVTELLESRRMDTAASPDMEQVEEIVKKAISFSGEHLADRGRASRQMKLAFIVSSCLSLAVAAYLLITGGIGNLLPGDLTIVFLSIFFGIYFCFFAKDRLPDYYDENRISCYSDGIFRLNLAGVRFSNRNWPYILKALRFWCCWAPIAMTLVMLAVRSFFPGLNNSIYLPAIFVIFLGGLFVPVYITAKRHE